MEPIKNSKSAGKGKKRRKKSQKEDEEEELITIGSREQEDNDQAMAFFQQLQEDELLSDSINDSAEIIQKPQAGTLVPLHFLCIIT